MPELAAADMLVVGKAKVWLINRKDSRSILSRDQLDREALAVRIRGRFAVAAPDLPRPAQNTFANSSGLSPASSRSGKTT